MNFRIHLFISTSFLLLLFSINLQTALAAIITSQASGNWGNSGVWGGFVPVDNDDVVIRSGTVVNLNTSLPSASSLRSLTIQSGATLIVTVNGSTLRLKGDLVNDGILNLWGDSTLSGSIIIYGNSTWSGNGEWTLSNLNLQGNSLELADGLSLTFYGDISALSGGGFNKINRRQNIYLTFKGGGNFSLPSTNASFYYGNITVNKTSGTVSFSASAVNNKINFSGDLNLVNSNDRLVINSNNILTIQGAVTGLGSISGGAITSSLVIDNLNATQINPLRILSGTSFRNFKVNRASGVVLSSGFIVRDSLLLNNSCRLTLSSQTLTLGTNTGAGSPGVFTGDGYLVTGSTTSSISLRGNSSSTYLRFVNESTSQFTLNNLTIDKFNGRVDLLGDLVISGSLDISDNNIFSVGTNNLTLRSVPHFFGSGCLGGSPEANLFITGNSKVGYSLQFDQSTVAGHTLKALFHSRKATVTLENPLTILGMIELNGDSSTLNSNGNLTLLSSATQSAGIGPLLKYADIFGDVNVQVYISGNNSDSKYRGYRSLSSPLNDNLIVSGQKKSLQQLKDYIILTGPGGMSRGFDQGGNAQPYAQTLLIYNSLARPGQLMFIPVDSIKQSLIPGTGFFAFFRGLQRGSYTLNSPKLNSPYQPPEPVTVVYKGPINKFDIPDITLHNTQDTTDEFRGYNLIGNPYPSSIDWIKVNRSAGVLDEVITIKPGGGTATYLNGFSNNGGSPYIQTGQGFYVRTTVDGATVSFKETCKTSAYPARLLSVPSENTSMSQDHTLKLPDGVKSSYRVLKLNLCNRDEKDETTIVFVAGGNEQADYNDASYFGGSTVSLSSLSADRKRLAINFMPDIHKMDTLNLSVNATLSGSYSLNFSDLPKSSMSIFLKDSLLQNQLTEVNEKFIYPFEIDRKIPETFGDNRFSLIFKKKPKNENTLASRGHSILAFPNPAITEVSFDSSSLPLVNKQVLIYDLLGRKRQILSFKAAEDIKADLSGFEPGLYVAKFIFDGEGRFLGESLFVKY